MAISFPVNPAPGALYSDGKRVWKFNGQGWQLDDVSLLHIGLNPPVDPERTRLWYRSDLAGLFAYYDSGVRKQWVDCYSVRGYGVLTNGPAIDFPDTDGQLSNGTFTFETGYASWSWDGRCWRATAAKSESIAILVDNSFQWYIELSGNDRTGDGSPAAPLRTPQEAMRRLTRMVLAADVQVTVNVGAGTFRSTSSILLDHPNGNQITFLGAPPTGARPKNSLTGDSVRGNSNATRSFNDALLNAHYTTVLEFNGPYGLRCTSGGGVTFDRMLIKGVGSLGGTTTSGVLAIGGRINLGSRTAVHNFSEQGIFATAGGAIECNGVTSTNCTRGISASGGGRIICDDALSSNHSATGITANLCASITGKNAIAQYCDSNGIGINGSSSAAMENTIAQFNGSDGIFVNTGSSGTFDGGGGRDNAYFGIRVINGSSGSTVGGVLARNGTGKWLVKNHSFLNVTNHSGGGPNGAFPQPPTGTATCGLDGGSYSVVAFSLENGNN